MGQWGQQQIECRPIQCPPITISQSISVSCSGDGVSLGSRCQYACAPGTRLIGSNSRVCHSDGAWTGVEPSCMSIDCGVPAVVADSSPAHCENGHGFNSTCKLQCGSRAPASTIRCDSDGQWQSQSGPACLYSFCSRPSLPVGIKVECGVEPTA